MIDSKKSFAEKIVYEALESASSKSGVIPVELFDKSDG